MFIKWIAIILILVSSIHTITTVFFLIGFSELPFFIMFIIHSGFSVLESQFSESTLSNTGLYFYLAVFLLSIITLISALISSIFKKSRKGVIALSTIVSIDICYQLSRIVFKPVPSQTNYFVFGMLFETVTLIALIAWYRSMKKPIEETVQEG